MMGWVLPHWSPIKKMPHSCINGGGFFFFSMRLRFYDSSLFLVGQSVQWAKASNCSCLLQDVSAWDGYLWRPLVQPGQLCVCAVLDKFAEVLDCFIAAAPSEHAEPTWPRLAFFFPLLALVRFPGPTLAWPKNLHPTSCVYGMEELDCTNCFRSPCSCQRQN